MTEAEWLACTDPMPMLEFLRGTASVRKLRLFTCASCRRIWHLFPDERCKKAVTNAELYADGLIGEEDRREAARSALEPYIYAAAAAEVALAGTWNPLDCLAAEHDPDQYEAMFAAACEEARQSPHDPCEAWVARESAHASYYTLVIDDDCIASANYHAAYAVNFFYGEDGWEAYCQRGAASSETVCRAELLPTFSATPSAPGPSTPPGKPARSLPLPKPPMTTVSCQPGRSKTLGLLSLPTP